MNMNKKILIAKSLVRLARELVSKRGELVIVPEWESLPRNIVSDAEGSSIGNKTDARFPYEVWAIDLVNMDENSPEFIRVRNLIQKIQGNPFKKWILWTEDENVGELERFCREQGLVPDAVNDNVEEVKDFYSANSRKVYAQHYIDHRNVTVNNLSRAFPPRSDGKKTVYAIDFDGTIAETDNTFPQVEKPIEKIVDFIKNVIQPDPNREWVLYTCRVGEAERIAERWCHENGLYPVAVNSNYRRHGNRKLNADYYIDDRNVDLSEISVP